MFLEDLAALKDRYPDRFHLIHILSREQQSSLARRKLTMLDSMNDSQSLLEVVRRGERLFNEAARRALDTSTSEKGRLRALIRGHLEVILDHRDEASTFLNEALALDEPHRKEVVAARDRYELIFRQVIGEGVSGGEFDERVDPVMAGIFILSILNSVGRWYRPEGALDREELAERIWEFVSSGMLLP